MDEERKFIVALPYLYIHLGMVSTPTVDRQTARPFTATTVNHESLSNDKSDPGGYSGAIAASRSKGQ